MADVVQISGGPEEAKIRSVFAPVLLPIITLGIYWLVWYYKINRELADLGRKHGTEELGTSPVKSLLAVTFGWILLFVPLILSIIGTWKRTKAAQNLVGVPESEQGSGALYALLVIFTGGIASGYHQFELNKIWSRQADAPAAAAAAAPVAVEGLGPDA